jgi:hypothetical protein
MPTEEGLMAYEIDVKVEVPVYEVDDQPVPLGDEPTITVSSDGNPSFVQLQVEQEGKRYTVSGAELRAAVARCERDA